MNCRVEITSSAARSIRKLPEPTKSRIAARIDRLAIEPRPAGSKKLTAKENIYRIRAGDFRILYSVEDNVLLVLVVSVGNRRDVYR